MVGGWFALLAARQLRRDTFRSTRALEQAIRTYVAGTNKDPKPFVWTKSADDILASIQRFCQQTSNSGHLDGSGQLRRPSEPARRDRWL